VRVVKVREDFSKSKPHIDLYPIGDTHLGAVDVDEATLKEHLKEIADNPNARIIFMGDCGDCITHRDPRFAAGMWSQRYIEAMHHEGGVVSATVDHVVELFDPVKDKVWAWLSGNHERTVRKHTDREIGNEICAMLGIPSKYMGYNGFVRVEWWRESSKAGGATAVTTIDVAHGWQAGRRSGSKLNQLELELSYSNADMILRGHSHDKVAQVIQSLRVECNDIRDWPRVVAHTGTYKQGWVDTGRGETHDTWEETRGFRKRGSSTTGPPIIRITPNLSTHKRRDGGTVNPNVNYEVRI
jgi:predicted phosphodiesterase